MSNDRTLPVTPAERFCATMLRAWKEWSTSENTGTPIAEATSIDATRSLRNRGWIDAFDLTPAGRGLLARVEAAERTAAVLRAMLRAYEDDLLDLEVKLARYVSDKGPWTRDDAFFRLMRCEQVPALRAR